MANKVFSKEEVKWLIDFIPGHTTEETTAAFIEKFNHNVLPTQIVSFRKTERFHVVLVIVLSQARHLGIKDGK